MATPNDWSSRTSTAHRAAHIFATGRRIPHSAHVPAGPMRLPFPILLCSLLAVASAEEAVTPFAALPPRADPPPDARKVELGRLLFFDPILSATKTVSCATCHQPTMGWADGKDVAVGLAPLKRNTPTILNTAFNTGGVMFWDNRETTLEAQVRHPILTREEMRGDVCEERDALDLATRRVSEHPAYAERFREAFGGGVTFARLASAIAAFERSLVTSDTPFDRFMRGEKSALNPAQQRGMKTFTQAGCQHCHGGAMLSDFKLHVIAAPGERQAFRTPSLRNLTHTAPYMHSGSLRTLDDVLLFYEQLMDEASETIEGGDKATHPPLDPLLRHLDLKPEDFPDLKAFLESLSATRYDQTAPATVPSGLKAGGE